MAHFQMIQKVIIVALLISASLAGELTNNTSQLQNPLQSINQSILKIQQPTQQINSSSINANNAPIQNKTNITVTQTLQNEEQTEFKSTKDNNLTDAVLNDKEAQIVEISTKKISESDQSLNKTDQILLGNFTLQVLSEKVDQTILIKPELFIKDKAEAESTGDDLTLGSTKEQVELNITNEPNSTINSTEKQTVSVSNESSLPILTQVPLNEVSKSESEFVNKAQSQVNNTLTTNNQTISHQVAPSSDNELPAQKEASQSAIPSANISDSSQSTVSNIQNQINQSQITDPNNVPEHQLLAQPSKLTNNTSEITSNQTVDVLEEVSIKANQSSVQNSQPSPDAVVIQPNISQKANGQKENIQQLVEQVIVGDNTSQIISQSIQQQTDNISVINIQTPTATTSQVLNQTVSPQNQQKNDGNNTSVIKNIQKEEEEAILISTSLQTDDILANQTKSDDLPSNPKQQPNPADDNQTVESTQQKPQKQVAEANITLQAQSNTTELIILSGKLPDEVELDSSESKKIEEVGKILAEKKEEENNEDEIVDKFMLQTDVYDSKNNDSSTIVQQQNTEEQKVIGTLSTGDDIKNNSSDDEKQANITADIEKNQIQTMEATKADNSSQIQNQESSNTSEIKNQSLILPGQQALVINQTKIVNQSSQVGQIQVTNLTSTIADQNSTSIEAQLSIQNTTQANTAQSTQHIQQNKQEPQLIIPVIEVSSNKTNTSLASSFIQEIQQNAENTSEANKKSIQEVKTIQNPSLPSKDQNATLAQTNPSNQKLENQTTEQLKNIDNTVSVATENQTKPQKPDNISKNIEQNNIIVNNITLVVPQQQEKIKTAEHKSEKLISNPLSSQKQEKKEKNKEVHQQVAKQSKNADQQEEKSMKVFDFKQPQIKKEDEKEIKQDNKQKPKSTIINKKPFKLHAQQLSKQKPKQKDEENNKEPRKIDQFNKQSSQLVEDIAKQKKSFDKKITSDKPKETTTIIQQNKQTFIQEKQQKSDNQIYVIAVFAIIGVFICHFLIKAFCGSKKKQGVRAQSTQDLTEEDEDFDLSCPDIAERLDEDY